MATRAPRPRLTKTLIEKAEPRARQYTLWCGALDGFGCWINPGGTRTYFVDYHVEDGTRRRMKIGEHGLLTAEKAREKAIVVLGAIASGADPKLDRMKRREAISVSDLCDEYLAAAYEGKILGKRKKPKKASTVATDRGRIERHIKPLLGRRKAKDLSPPDIVKFMEDVADGRTAMVETTEKLRGKSVVTGGRGTATRTTGLLGGILTYALSKGLIERNPVTGIRRPADEEKERRLSVAEYRRLGTALTNASVRGETWQTVEAIWLFALTGCRKSELLSLRWADVDLDGRCLRLADSKEGKSLRPLGRPAIERLGKLSREGEFVLPAVRKKGGSFGGLTRGWNRIRVSAALDEAVTLHTLRHSFASVASDLKCTEATIAVLLGHGKLTTTARYIHQLDDVLAAAVTKVVRQIQSNLTGGSATDRKGRSGQVYRGATAGKRLGRRL